MRKVLRIDGNRDGVKTEFPHVDHQNRLGKEQSCQRCHHIAMPRDNATPCYRCHSNMLDSADIFDHFGHMQLVAEKEKLEGLHPKNHSCSRCHNPSMPNTASNAKACTECHKEDMKIGNEPYARLQLASASPYRSAMHENCIECHEKEGIKQNKPNLGHCSTCHKSLEPVNLKIAKSADTSEASSEPLTVAP
ncbi:MAG: cytochrome c3 family protein [candidate division Zixibacteria bacterium]|nr:cytochrome c3 family protein [candidate division Zixibacteria bacterium]NIR64902.1 cytochrome c3 family protein [candidate division Zixibacteria bacterium]NIS17707.1 cytochrome c3 family protein [candidate division Zixibacteria bacterium]NIS46708.1 cytochrome c3 family protein [candidate division Zixibacteria bacterium]NIT54023.1 cytochrome c3 family protein [candidate division Zixibacteria bacterium]